MFGQFVNTIWFRCFLAIFLFHWRFFFILLSLQNLLFHFGLTTTRLTTWSSFKKKTSPTQRERERERTALLMAKAICCRASCVRWTAARLRCHCKIGLCVDSRRFNPPVRGEPARSDRLAGKLQRDRPTQTGGSAVRLPRSGPASGPASCMLACQALSLHAASSIDPLRVRHTDFYRCSQRNQTKNPTGRQNLR